MQYGDFKILSVKDHLMARNITVNNSIKGDHLDFQSVQTTNVNASLIQSDKGQFQYLQTKHFLAEDFGSHTIEVQSLKVGNEPVMTRIQQLGKGHSVCKSLIANSTGSVLPIRSILPGDHIRIGADENHIHINAPNMNTSVHANDNIYCIRDGEHDYILGLENNICLDTVTASRFIPSGKTLLIQGDVTTTGDLIIAGNAISLDIENLSVEDKTIDLAVHPIEPNDIYADGGGIVLKGTTDHSILWDRKTDCWTINGNLNIQKGLWVGDTNIASSDDESRIKKTIVLADHPRGSSDEYANGGGIVLKGTTNHSILWKQDAGGWNVSGNMHVEKNLRIGTKTPLTHVQSCGNGTSLIHSILEEDSATCFLKSVVGGSGIAISGKQNHVVIQSDLRPGKNMHIVGNELSTNENVSFLHVESNDANINNIQAKQMNISQLHADSLLIRQQPVLQHARSKAGGLSILKGQREDTIYFRSIVGGSNANVNIDDMDRICIDFTPSTWNEGRNISVRENTISTKDNVSFRALRSHKVECKKILIDGKEPLYALSSSPNGVSILSGQTSLKSIEAGDGIDIVSDNETIQVSVRKEPKKDMYCLGSNAANCFSSWVFGNESCTRAKNIKDTIAIGDHILEYWKGGDSMIGIGSYSLHNNTSGRMCIGIGKESLRGNDSGVGNTACGHFSMKENTTGTGCAAYGLGSLMNNRIGNNICCYGPFSLVHHKSGDDLIAIGVQCMAESIQSERCISIGNESLSKSEKSRRVIACGHGAFGDVSSSLSDCIALGDCAGLCNTGNGCILIGCSVGLDNYKNGQLMIGQGENVLLQGTFPSYGSPKLIVNGDLYVRKEPVITNISSGSNGVSFIQNGRGSHVTLKNISSDDMDIIDFDDHLCIQQKGWKTLMHEKEKDLCFSLIENSLYHIIWSCSYLETNSFPLYIVFEDESSIKTHEIVSLNEWIHASGNQCCLECWIQVLSQRPILLWGNIRTDIETISFSKKTILHTPTMCVKGFSRSKLENTQWIVSRL